MNIVEVRNIGELCWRPVAVVLGAQAARTVAAATKSTEIRDTVRSAPAGPGRALDLRV